MAATNVIFIINLLIILLIKNVRKWLKKPSQLYSNKFS